MWTMLPWVKGLSLRKCNLHNPHTWIFSMMIPFMWNSLSLDTWTTILLLDFHRVKRIWLFNMTLRDLNSNLSLAGSISNVKFCNTRSFCFIDFNYVLVDVNYLKLLATEWHKSHYKWINMHICCTDENRIIPLVSIESFHAKYMISCRNFCDGRSSSEFQVSLHFPPQNNKPLFLNSIFSAIIFPLNYIFQP